MILFISGFISAFAIVGVFKYISKYRYNEKKTREKARAEMDNLQKEGEKALKNYEKNIKKSNDVISATTGNKSGSKYIKERLKRARKNTK